MGGCVTLLKEAEMARLGLAGEPLAVSCWRGMSSISIMVSKQEAMHMVDKVEAAVHPAADAYEVVPEAEEADEEADEDVEASEPVDDAEEN
eukprot:scaffold637288_cov45-Prasinocladus_malaysianus.AAC.1